MPIASTDVCDPLSVDGAIYQSIIPKRIVDGWARVAELPDGFDWNLRHSAIGQSLHTVIRDAEKRVLKVDQIAFHVNGKNLPTAVPNDLVANAESRNDHPALRDRVTFGDDRLLLPNGYDRMG